MRFDEISHIASRSRRLGFPTTFIEIAVFLSIFKREVISWHSSSCLNKSLSIGLGKGQLKLDESRKVSDPLTA